MLSTGFNAFQIVVLFAAMPFIVQWTASKPAPFVGADAAYWLSIVTYVVLFFLQFFATADYLRRGQK